MNRRHELEGSIDTQLVRGRAICLALLESVFNGRILISY